MASSIYDDDEDDIIPLPSYRHAMPSGPWPWTDIGTRDDTAIDDELTCHHENCEECKKWLNYPRSLFPNWTAELVGRSGMLEKSARQNHCQMYRLDVMSDGAFTDVLELPVHFGQEKQFWDEIHTPVCFVLVCSLQC